MAKKGIQYAVFAKLTEAEGTGGAMTYTYSNGKYLSPVASYTGTPNNSNVKDYGDDRCVEVANETVGGTLSVELTNDDEDIFTLLLGHVNGATGEIDFNVNDEIPYVGTGAIGKSGSQYRAIWYPKVIFSEPTDENTTRQESTAFGHVTLEGDIVPLTDGTWKTEKRFDTLAAAKTWLNGKAGITG